MNFIQSKALNEALKSENICILDVRTNTEFMENSIQNSIHIPLNDLKGNEQILNEAKQIVIVCKGGVRACKGFERLSLENQQKAKVLDGGIDEWIKNRLPVNSQRKIRFPIINQMQMIIGLMLVIFALCTIFVNKWFILGSLFIGFMLFIAGLSGFCLLINILAKMPWNR